MLIEDSYNPFLRIHLHTITIFQDNRRDSRAYDAGLLHFTRNDSRMTDDAAFVSYECGRLFHGRQEVRGGHRRDEDIALLNLGHLKLVFDDSYRALRLSLESNIAFELLNASDRI